jgi:DNA-directed RNA polymerase subunit beta'
VEDGDEVEKDNVIAFLGEEASITAQNAGHARIETRDSSGDENDNGDKVIVSYELREEVEYELPTSARLLYKDGDRVEAGEPITEGSLNPHTILRIQGRNPCQVYLMSEVQKVYRSQGQNINDKHYEVIIRKMLSKVHIIRPGDSSYLPGDEVDYLELRRVNDELLAEGKLPAEYKEVLLGITKASLSTESFLSASSFQHTIKVLANAAISGKEDLLYGLKENVIIGKLIPAGSGYSQGRIALEQDPPELEAIAVVEELDEVKVTEVVPESVKEEEVTDLELSVAD